jgi:cytochrome P450
MKKVVKLKEVGVGSIYLTLLILDQDRRIEEFEMHLPRFSYFPFGGGIRGCIGEPFAWQEGILLMATISSSWSMRPAPNQRFPGITLNPKNRIKMKLS